jgi:hypothetical protein
MRQFRVRDLMINVLPEGELPQGDLQPFCKVVTLPDCVYNTEIVDCAISLCRTISRCAQVTLLAACDADGGSSCDACVTKGTVTTGGCKPGTGGKIGADIGQYLDDLAILKAELTATLSRIETRERVVEESLRPQSLDDVQQLEEKLTGALEELRARRTEIERTTPKSTK